MEVVVEPRRAPGPDVDLDPEADAVDGGSLRTDHRRAPFGPAAPAPGAERGEEEAFVEHRRHGHPEHRAPDEPAHGVVESGVDRVVGGDVLQVPSDRVQSKLAVTVDVTEADRALGGERPPPLGHGQQIDGRQLAHVSCPIVSRSITTWCPSRSTTSKPSRW